MKSRLLSAILIFSFHTVLAQETMRLSKTSVWASIGIGQEVAEITGGTPPYRLVGKGFDNGAFTIRENKLLANTPLHIYSKKSLHIQISDASGEKENFELKVDGLPTNGGQVFYKQLISQDFGSDQTSFSDFNNDNKLDYLYANDIFINKSFGVLVNDFNQEKILTYQHPNIFDANQDNLLDIIAGYFQLNKGNGIFDKQQQNFLDFAYEAITVGDLTGDGSMDLVVYTSFPSYLTLIMQFQNGQFVTTDTLDFDVYFSSFGDWDRDGDLDMFEASSSTVYLNDGQGQFSNLFSISINSYPARPTFADFNNDGLLDLFFQGDRQQYGTSSLWLNRGEGRLPIKVFDFGYLHEATIADFNGDGWLDIIAHKGLFEGDVKLWENHKGVRFEARDIYPRRFGVMDYIASGDVDGDGDVDFASDNYVMFNNGTTLRHVEAQDNGFGAVSLQWESLEYPECFVVERSVGKSGWEQLAVLPKLTSTFSDENAPLKGNLYYRVGTQYTDYLKNKNTHFSDPITVCRAPYNLQAQKTGGKATLTWEGDAPSYVVRYRAKGANWHTQTTTAKSMEIKGVRKGVSYEWEVASKCGKDDMSGFVRWGEGKETSKESSVGTPTTGISIFPNPTTGKVTLSGVSHDAQVAVYTVQGQMVVATKGNTIDLSSQPKGVYLVKVVSEGNVWNGKVVKE